MNRVTKPSATRKPSAVRKPSGGGSEPLFPRLREALAPPKVPDVVREVVRAVASEVVSAGASVPITTPPITTPSAKDPEIGRVILENAPALIWSALDGEITETEAHAFIDRAARVAHEIVSDAYNRKK